MLRIGIGTDTHRLVEGRELVLGGVTQDMLRKDTNLPMTQIRVLLRYGAMWNGGASIRSM